MLKVKPELKENATEEQKDAEIHQQTIHEQLVPVVDNYERHGTLTHTQITTKRHHIFVYRL